MTIQLSKIKKKRLYFENNLDKILSIFTLISIFYTIFFIPFYVGFAYNVYDAPRFSVVDILFDCIFFGYVLRRATYFCLYDLNQTEDHNIEHNIWGIFQRNTEEENNLHQISTISKELNYSTSKLNGVIKANVISNQESDQVSNGGISGNKKGNNKTESKFRLIKSNIFSYIFLPRHFALDLLCIVPFDIILGDSFVRISKLPIQKSIFYHLLLRLPRLCRILRYNEIVNAFFLDPQGKPKSFKMIALFILFLTFQHWFACSWSWNTVIPFTGEVGEMDGGSTFWSTVYFTQVNTTWDATNSFSTSITNPDSPNYVDRWTRYSNVIYFINWNFLSVGLGDMHAQNTSERILNCIIILTGAICLSFIIGNISVYIYEMVKQQNQKKLESEKLSTWLSHYMVPYHIRRVVMSSLISLQEYTPVETKSFFIGLPYSFAASIVCRTHEELFENSSILSGISSELKYELSLLLSCVELAPGDIISEIDSTVHQIVFVTGGLLEAVIDINQVSVKEELQDNYNNLVSGGTTLGYYSQHSVPSIAAVMFKTKEECTIRSLTHCNIIMIDANKFRDVLSCGLYEADKSTFQILAMNQRLSRQAQWDLVRSKFIKTTIQTSSKYISSLSNNASFNFNDNDFNNIVDEEGGGNTIGRRSIDGNNEIGGECYLNDEKVFKSQIPLSRFPPNPAVWNNVIRTKSMYQFTTYDLQSQGLWFPTFRAYVANYYGISLSLLIGSSNVSKAVKIEGDESYHELFIRGIVPPYSPAKSLWDMFVGIAVIYTIIMTPLLLGFSMSNNVTDMLEYVVTSIFGFDILVSSRSTKLAPKAKSVDTVPLVLMKNYLKGGFLFDFISTMPWDYVLMASFQNKNQSANLRIMRLIRLLRLTRILRVVKIWNDLFRIKMLQKFMSEHRTMFELMAMVFQISYLCHLFGCLFSFFIHFNGDSRQWWKSSILTTTGSKLDPTQPDSGTISVTYLAAYYWAMSTLSTTGIGDVYAYTIESHAFAIFAMTIGVILFAIFAGKIAAVIETVTINSVIRGVISDWYQFARNVNGDESSNIINGIVQQRIAEFHRVRIRQDSHIDPTEIIQKLPYYVKRKLMLSVHQLIGDTLPLGILKYYRNKLYGNNYISDVEKQITAAHVPAEFAFAVISKLRPRWLMPQEDGFSNGGLGVVSFLVSGSFRIGLRHGESNSRRNSTIADAFKNLMDISLSPGSRSSMKSIHSSPESSLHRRLSSLRSPHAPLVRGRSRLIPPFFMDSESIIEESVTEILPGDQFFPSELNLDKVDHVLWEHQEENGHDRGKDDLDNNIDDEEFNRYINEMTQKSVKSTPFAFATSITKLLILDVEVNDQLIVEFSDIIKKGLVNDDQMIL